MDDQKKPNQWLEVVGQIFFEGLGECEIFWVFLAVAVCLFAVAGLGYFCYELVTDPHTGVAALGSDLSTYFDSISINPDKWR